MQTPSPTKWERQGPAAQRWEGEGFRPGKSRSPHGLVLFGRHRAALSAARNRLAPGEPTEAWGRRRWAGTPALPRSRLPL